MIFGVDECGLGALAGPLVVCAFAAPSEAWFIEGLKDSKKFSSKKKMGEVSLTLTQAMPLAYITQKCDSSEIDRKGIARCLRETMNNVVDLLVARLGIPDRVIIDGEDKGVYGAEFYPEADGTYPAVMAASIIGKVHHDALMAKIAQEYPQFGFEESMGYPTKQHHAAIQEHGLCPHHRRSYAPIAAYQREHPGTR